MIHNVTIANSFATPARQPLVMDFEQPRVHLTFNPRSGSSTDGLDFFGSKGAFAIVRELEIAVQTFGDVRDVTEAFLTVGWHLLQKPMIQIPTQPKPVIVVHDANLEMTTLVLPVPQNAGGELVWVVGGTIPGFVLNVKVRRKNE